MAAIRSSRLQILAPLMLAVAGLLIPSTTRAASLLGVTFFDGAVWEVDPLTASAGQLQPFSRARLNSLAAHAGLLHSVSNTTGELISIDPATGLVVQTLALDLGPLGVDVRGLAFSPDGSLFAINRLPQVSLHEIDLSTGRGTLVGNLNSAFQALEFSPSGVLYGWSFSSGLVVINSLSGAITDVSPLTVGEPMQSLAFDMDGTLYGILNGADFGRFTGLEIHTIDVTTGVSTLLSFTGQGGPSLRGIAFVPEPGLSLLLGASFGLLPATRRLTRRCS